MCVCVCVCLCVFVHFVSAIFCYKGILLFQLFDVFSDLDYRALRYIFSATDVLSQAIELQTEMGLKAQEILLHGEAIPEEMAAKMIEDKINSPEVLHHGEISSL